MVAEVVLWAAVVATIALDRAAVAVGYEHQAETPAAWLPPVLHLPANTLENIAYLALAALRPWSPRA